MSPGYKADLGDVLRYKGDLHEVIGLSDGRCVILAPINAAPCPQCGNRFHKEMLENAPLFQDAVEPVHTIRRVGE